MDKKILCVMNADEFLKVLIGDKLRGAGYCVEFGDNHRECVRYIRQENPHLLVYDLLVDEDGMQVLEHVREDDQGKSVKIIVFADKENETEEIRKLGVEEYLLKSSFTLDELLEKVNKLLN